MHLSAAEDTVRALRGELEYVPPLLVAQKRERESERERYVWRKAAGM